jgi:GMP synthase (glutamine-hydrolysing)
MTVRVAFLQHSEWDVPGLLGRHARELGFATRSYRADQGAGELPAVGTYELLVVMGSAESVTDRAVGWIGPERALVAAAVAAGVPVLGICFGGQLLAEVLGADVTRACRREIGWSTLDTERPELVPAGPWLLWHEDRFSAPDGAHAVARTEVCLQAFVLGVHTGLQFHPEVDREIVAHWVADARDQGIVDDATAGALLDGFDADGRGPEEQTRRLFDGFVARAGLGV